jgi:23S rRNA (guanosine2251-2'-O)-methyltransferase
MEIAGTRERLFGIHPVLEALRARRRSLERVLIRRGRRERELTPILAAASAAGVPVVEIDGLEFAASGALPRVDQGVALDAGPLPQLKLPELLGDTGESRWLLALDEVVDPQNVGAIARVAVGFGVAGLVLTEHNSPPLSPAVSRASAGAIEWLPVARVPNLVRALSELREAGFWSIAAEANADTELYTAPARWTEGDLVLVLGAEGRGVRRLVRESTDYQLAIPLRGAVSSLNVSTAAAVFLGELTSRRLRRVESPDPVG